jgi:hypothetical protein
MKRFSTAFAIAVLALFVAQPALAAFGKGRLVQVVYKNDDVEIGADLLDIVPFNFSQQNVQVSPPGTFSLAKFSTTKDWSRLRASLFAYFTAPGVGEAWFATVKPTAPSISSSSLGAFIGGATSISSYYNGQGEPPIVALPDYINSYNVKMNSNGNVPGYFAGYNADFIDGEATLGPLATVGYVDMYLYRFNLSILVPGSGGKPYSAVLRLKADGSTVLNPPSAATAPVIAAIPDGAVNEGEFYTGPTPSLSSGTQPVTWSLVAGPAGMTIDSATGVVSWPGPAVAGSPHTITIQAANAAGTDDESWLLTVNPVAPVVIAPEISPIADGIINEGSPYAGATPALVKGTLPVTWSLVAGPADMTINASTGVVSWPSPTATGSPHAIRIRAANSADADEEDWLLNVTPVVAAPVIADIPDAALVVGNAYTGPTPTLLQGSAPLTWSLATGPAGMAINASTGVVSWSSPTTAGSPHTVTIRAANSAGTDDESWLLTLTSQAVAPVLSSTANASAVALKPFMRSAPALAQGTLPVAWSLVSGPPGMTIDPATGEVRWASPSKAGSPHTVTIRAANSAGSDEKSWQLTVTNQAPAAPSVNAPANGGEVENRQPELSINNASDPDGQVITYTFELYSDAGLTVKADAQSGVAQGTNTTAWRTNIALSDNTLYYWRALASDGIENSLWTAPASFFVNTANDPPGAPSISSPANGAKVPNLRPTLQVTNAVDPDRDPLVYEFEVYADQALTILVITKTGVVQGAGGATGWQVNVELKSGSNYFWRARATDNKGLAGSWTLPAAFSVAINTPPAAPAVFSPLDGAEVIELQPELSIRNSQDPDGNGLNYFFEIDRVNSFNGPDLQRSGEIPDGPAGKTSWRPAALTENTEYFWRVKASDGQVESLWVVADFFVNTSNEPPPAVTIANPPDNGQVTSANPTLAVNPASDPDRDPLLYEFELFADPKGGNLLGSRKTQETAWLVALPLVGQVKYYWRVRAIDEHGASSPWSGLSAFTVNINVAPAAPAPNNPVSGGTVTSLNPTLSVFNAKDANDDNLSYEFEVYADKDLYYYVASAVIPQQNEITSWRIETTLTDATTYYWRVRANDGKLKSSWMPTAIFHVATSGAETVGSREANVDVHASAQESQYVQVTNPESRAYGVSLEIPAGALQTDLAVTIGVIANPPALPAETMSVGVVLNFGPEGAIFSVPVTLRIPYTQDELERAGISDPAQLKVFTYHPQTQTWEEVPVAGVLKAYNLLLCQVGHFSMYTTAATAAPGSSGGGGTTSGGGGGGGCFIQALTTKEPNPFTSLINLLLGVIVTAGFFLITNFSRRAHHAYKLGG